MTGVATAAPRLAPDLRALRSYGHHGWAAWAVGMLRSAGFPADGLDLLSVPELGPAADAVLVGGLSAGAFAEQFQAASLTISRRISEIAADPHLAMAIAWQNPAFLPFVEKLRVPADRLNAARRSRERRLALYWQRYCGKADTIGSFGPFAWFEVGRPDGICTAEHGDALVERSRANFEAWMVVELGNWLAARPELRCWLPPTLNPMVELDERAARLVLPGQPAVRLRPLEMAVLRLADGTRSAHAVGQLVGLSRPSTTEADVHRVLDSFARRRLLAWDANIPISVTAWQVFRERIAAVEEPGLRVELDALVARFEAHLATIAAAEDATELVAALERLDDDFRATTGQEAHRAAGGMYAARSLCYFDAHRAVRGGVGMKFLDAIDEPLALLLRSADWYADRLTRGYSQALTALVERYREAHPGRPVHLSDVWSSSMALFWSDAPVPLEEATADLSGRWAGVLGRFASTTNQVRLASADLAKAVHAAFPETRPLPELSVHSPDLQIIATDLDALNRGDFTVILGELHACYASLDIPAVEWTLPHGTVREAINDVLGLSRLVPLFPESWRRNTGRVVTATIGSADRLLGFTRAATPDRTRVWSMAAVEIVDGADGLELLCPDGHRRSLVAPWLVPIGMVAADGFKVGLGGPHTPRLTVDRLVLFRETWRLPTTDLELPATPNRLGDYLAVRAWRLRHGLPEEVFTKFPAEVKPTYLSFNSPPLVATLAASVRAQRVQHEEGRVTMSECLPRPQESWLVDTHGRRYVSEVRLQLTRRPEARP